MYNILYFYTTGRAGVFTPAPPQTLNELCYNAAMSLGDRDLSPSFVMSTGGPSFTETLLCSA